MHLIRECGKYFNIRFLFWCKASVKINLDARNKVETIMFLDNGIASFIM